MPRLLVGWVLLRVGVLLAVLVFPSHLVTLALRHVADPHGLSKTGVIALQSLLRRQHAVAAVLVLALVAGFVLPRLDGRRRWGAAALAVALAALLVPSPVFLGLLVLLGLNLGPWRLPRVLAFLPGTELITPLALLRTLGWPWRAVAPVVAVGMAGGALVADTLARFGTYERALFEPWPEALEDARVERVENAPPGVKCDYHDVDLVDGRAIVVAEGSGRLLSFPGGASAKLPGLWAPRSGLAVDSETDPRTGITYLMGGPDWVRALRWTGRWQDAGRSPSLQPPQPMAYLRLYDDRLAIVSVNARSEGLHPLLTTLDLRLSDVRSHEVRDPEGRPLPTIRDIEWLPTLHRLVLAPDMGDRLYLLDPDTGLATPWITVPTQDGRPRWSQALGELILPIPTRMELWFIQPATGAIRKLPTQPGVRTADVDVTRGVFLTASVFTGQVLIQRLDTGAIVDRIGTLMPMVRTLAVADGGGEAWLTTWTALYHFTY